MNVTDVMNPTRNAGTPVRNNTTTNNGTSGYSSTTGASGSSNTNQTQGFTSASGMQDFFKLIVEQLKAQDPMNPQSNTEMIGQMAQMEALSKMEEMAKATNSLVAFTQLGQASSLIGRNITAMGTDGLPVEGEVSKVVSSEGNVFLLVGDVKVPMASIQTVE